MRVRVVRRRAITVKESRSTSASAWQRKVSDEDVSIGEIERARVCVRASARERGEVRPRGEVCEREREKKENGRRRSHVRSAATLRSQCKVSDEHVSIGEIERASACASERARERRGV